MARAERFKGAGLDGDLVKAGAVFADGDVISPKIDNVKLLAEPKDGSKVVGTLKSTDKLVYLGEEKEGFLKVQGSDAEGWVKKALIKK
jgi:SH3-like domain-containing protein